MDNPSQNLGMLRVCNLLLPIYSPKFLTTQPIIAWNVNCVRFTFRQFLKYTRRRRNEFIRKIDTASKTGRALSV